MEQSHLSKNVDAVRRFNRFYTNKIGLLTQKFLKTKYPLTQARILFELNQHDQTTSKQLIQTLEIDPGYLSRILNTFEKDGLVIKSKSGSDNRKILLNVTPKGKKEFSILNNRSRNDVLDLIKNLTEENRDQLLHAMRTIEDLLDLQTKSPTTFFLRTHRPGDIGWMTYRHGLLYAEEYGFDETFEALVADILVQFIKKHDPIRERIWIAEQLGERVGSIMIVDAGEEIAQLRLLLVEPKARGKGLGKQLIHECIRFSKHNGYKKIKLWTQSNLLEARHLYTKAGFKIVEEKPHKSFGHDLVAEIWELPLNDE